MRHLHLRIILILAASALAAGARAASLTVLTYNAWHGTFRTTDSGVLEFPSETAQHQRLRHLHQVSQLDALRPDVILLQEVNPLPRRARQLAAALGYDEWHQTTDCGIKLFGLGLPSNVNSGLAILSRPALRLRPITVERLSGRWAFCGDHFGFQIEEARYALIAELTLESGDSYLVVNTHLHNAPRMSESLRQGLSEMHADGRLSQHRLRAIHGAVERGRARQREETERLILGIQRLQQENRELAGVILGGDLNAPLGSVPLRRLRRAGLADTAMIVEPPKALPTYDAGRNPLARALTRITRPEIPTFGDTAILELERRSRLLEARRIDYLLVSENLAATVVGVRRFGLDAGEPPHGHDAGARFPFTLVGSDHYGLSVVLALERPW